MDHLIALSRFPIRRLGLSPSVPSYCLSATPCLSIGLFSFPSTAGATARRRFGRGVDERAHRFYSCIKDAGLEWHSKEGKRRGSLRYSVACLCWLQHVCIQTFVDGVMYHRNRQGSAISSYRTKIRLLSRSYDQLGEVGLPSTIKSHSNHANALSSVHQAHAPQQNARAMVSKFRAIYQPKQK